MVARILLRHVRAAASEVKREARQLAAAKRLRGAVKLQLGAGPNPLPGWSNLDLEGDNIIWDLTRPLPIEGKSVRLVYSEHFIEHVTRDQALAILTNLRNVMVPDGVIRLSTPDLKRLVSDYQDGKVMTMEHGGWFPQTPCRMVNEAMHLWGHQFLYDEPEMMALLAEAGFRDSMRVARGESSTPELRGLETRPDFDDLIVEARA